uniref:Putative the biotinyl-domain or biotin carboxyl carrier protein n=1 Tax=Ixodes ricinus TaxID=34613 RepID=A0A0K8RGR3_IXORI
MWMRVVRVLGCTSIASILRIICYFLLVHWLKGGHYPEKKRILQNTLIFKHYIFTSIYIQRVFPEIFTILHCIVNFL